MARSPGITKAQKLADDERFVKDLTLEVTRIDRLLELNREERRQYGIILNTTQLKAAKTYLLKEIEAATPARGR